ncbi:MAG: thiamine phosphate synthase [Pedobacter sp.]|nr:MAG: thiamine phosphate synthase [Pedobacter sp.]
MIDKLHYISQPAADGTHLTAIAEALNAGCKWIQLRIKNQPESDVLNQAKEAVKLCTKHDAKLIVNDYPEIALQAGAYGLHLGLDDMSVASARAIVGDNLIIGGTANTFDHIIQRIKEGVDYVGLGPYRFTTTKKKLSPILGLNGYRYIMEKLTQANITIPIIAIGGIQPEDIPGIIELDLYGVAMSGAITKAQNPRETIQTIYNNLNSAHHV